MTATTLTPPPGLGELVARPNWVGYKGKVPYQVQRDKRGEDVGAKAGDPTTWDTFEAVAAGCATGRFDGPGYEFHDGEGFVGIDLDNVLDPDTGALTPLARAIVCLADTYAEPSPSGRGVHIIGKGELPRPEIEEDRLGKKKGSYELYGGARYFRMTLRPFAGYGEVREIDPATMRRLFALMWPEDVAPKPKPTPARAPATLAIADDAALLEKAFGAANGEDFRRRHSGQYLQDDKSADDFAYLSTARFWTQGDPARMRRIALSSGRVRDKWHTRRGTGDWLDYSIARSLSEPHEVYNPATYQSSTPPRAGTDAGDAPSARLAELERENAEQAVALKRCGAESARKDARIRELETEVRMLKAAHTFPDQTVGGCLPGIAETIAEAYRDSNTLVLDGREFARVVKKDAGRHRSPGTGGRAVERIIAQERISCHRRTERIETPTYKGETEIVYILVPEEHRRTPADIALYLLPPPPAQKAHGGRKTLTLPPEVAAQDVPVRRSRQTTEKFYRLDADRNASPLAVVAHPATVDYWRADGTAMPIAEAETFQVEIGVQPPPPPPWRPVQRTFQVDGLSTKGTSGQVDRFADAAAGPFQVDRSHEPTPLHRNQGCRVPSCGSPPTGGGYCARHHPDTWARYERGDAPVLWASGADD